ncbi:hypothetical protein, partial [Flammeovirga aprica]
MKNIYLIFAMLIAMVSCNNQEEVIAPSQEPRSISVTPTVDLVVSPMSGKHEAQDGLLTDNYLMSVTDDLGNNKTIYIDDITDDMTYDIDSMYGTVYINVYREGRGEPYKHYTLTGEAIIPPAQISTTIEMANRQYAYLVVNAPVGTVNKIYRKYDEHNTFYNTNDTEYDGRYAYFSQGDMFEVIIEYTDGSYEMFNTGYLNTDTRGPSMILTTMYQINNLTKKVSKT